MAEEEILSLAPRDWTFRVLASLNLALVGFWG